MSKKFCLVSVSDKSSLKLVLPVLKKHAYTLLSTGGTYEFIKQNGFEVISVELSSTTIFDNSLPVTVDSVISTFAEESMWMPIPCISETWTESNSKESAWNAIIPVEKLLINKLEIVTKNIEMSNVCYVPLQFLFTRGQSIKLFSLCLKYYKEAGYVFPVQLRDINYIDYKLIK